MRIDFQPPVMKCDLINASAGIYYQNYVFYKLPCIEVDFQCDRSLFYSDNMNFTITVVSQQNGQVVFPQKQEDTNALKAAVIILTLALIIVLLLLIAGVVFLCRLLGSAKPPGSLPIGTYAERVMSKEELQIFGTSMNLARAENVQTNVVTSEQLKGVFGIEQPPKEVL